MDNVRSPYVVVVHNSRWGNFVKEFQTKKEAVSYVDSICADMNTYCFMYKLVSINNEKRG